MKDLIDLDKRHFIHPTSSLKQQQEKGAKVIFETGEGIYLKDKNGNAFIDAMSSLWNVHIGHGRKELALAAAEQMEKLAFSSAFSTFSHEPAIRLAEKIASLAPGDLNAVFFTSGGSESNDSAIKLARHYWKIQEHASRKKIISLKRGYHGVAAASTSATGIPEFWGMAGRMMHDFIHADTHYKNTTEHALNSLRRTIEEEGREQIAAIIVEPVQGAGGVLIPPSGYLRGIRDICDEYSILFIADEVITGFGRTGKMFGMENWGVVPDMITFAKGITSGYLPLGGVIVSDSIHNTLKEKSKGTLFHGFTYSGHPTAAAVALKNLEIIEKESLVDHSQKMGEYLRQGFQQLKNELEIVGDIRAIGLLGAIELMELPEMNKHFPSNLQVASKVIEALHDRGVICRAVTYDNTDIICFSPPLIISEKEINIILEKLHASILSVQKEMSLAQ